VRERDGRKKKNSRIAHGDDSSRGGKHASAEGELEKKESQYQPSEEGSNLRWIVRGLRRGRVKMGLKVVERKKKKEDSRREWGKWKDLLPGLLTTNGGEGWESIMRVAFVGRGDRLLPSQGFRGPLIKGKGL